jgi:vancomycin permeability regulator SanA
MDEPAPAPGPDPEQHLEARPRRRRRLRLLASAVSVGSLLVLCPLVYVATDTAAQRYDVPTDVPRRGVAIVLGAGLRPDGSPTPFLRDRVDAAVELYRLGAVERLLVTGDNSRTAYDETTAMRDRAVAAGVPAERITEDYAGFSTYDSCARAKRVFGVDEAVVITQGYHLPRAVYTCRQLGIDAVGLGLADWENPGYAKRMPRYQGREVLSTFKALWELHVTRPDPHFL